MKYFKITVKFGHVGKSNFYKGYGGWRKDLQRALWNSEPKALCRIYCRYCPRVKHDHKDAILNVEEIDKDLYFEGLEKNRAIRYFSCYNVQEQRECFCEIEDSIFKENDVEYKHARHSKKRSLRKNYNDDPEFDYYKHNKNFDFFVA